MNLHVYVCHTQHKGGPVLNGAVGSCSRVNSKEDNAQRGPLNMALGVGAWGLQASQGRAYGERVL